MAPDVGATPEMAVFCFDVITAALNNHREPLVPEVIPNEKLFVSYKKKSFFRNFTN